MRQAYRYRRSTGAGAFSKMSRPCPEATIATSRTRPVHVSFPDYDFASQRFQVPPGIRMHYLDEGPRDGEVVLALPGNPSWSYYWRHLVRGLRDRYRGSGPAHVGMGLSDKPDDDRNALPRDAYTLQSRVDDLAARLDHRRIDGPVTLAV